MFYIIKCISKFQEELINQEVILRIDWKSTKEITEKDVKNLVSRLL